MILRLCEPWGANNGFIKQIFIWYGLLAGMKGCLIGIVLGVVLALNLTPIIQGIETLLGKNCYQMASISLISYQVNYIGSMLY